MDEEIPDDPRKFGEDEVRELLTEALKQRVNDPNRKKPTKVQLHSSLKSVLGEFLSCYRIMGFDLDGKSVDITAIHSEMEKAAMDTQFMELFGKFMGNKNRDL